VVQLMPGLFEPGVEPAWSGVLVLDGGAGGEVRGSRLVASWTGCPSALMMRSRTRISSPAAMRSSVAVRSSAGSWRIVTCTLGSQPPSVASVVKVPRPAERSSRLNRFRARRWTAGRSRTNHPAPL
jgi:hypothetical protein